jgi:arylsulfatase A-like enzyme
VRIARRHAAGLAAIGLALFAASCERGREPPPGAPKHVLLISIDTLRADRCGFGGYSQPTTPFLDSLAAQGVVFENHFANSNNTLISHASILTGLVPAAHGTVDGGGANKRRRLAEAYETLAEHLREGGYTTAAFTAHPAWLGDRFGLQQGFEHLETQWWDAPTLSRAFLRWLDREAPANLFAFLHFYDTHSEAGGRGGVLPYDSSAELIEQFAGPTPEGFTGTVRDKPYMCCSRFLRAVNDGEESLAPDHVRYVSGLYDAGIAKIDRDLAALFGELRRRGLLEDTLVVITSDHGEAFMEHGQMLHGDFHDEIARIPLIVIPPRARRAAAGRVSAITRSIDVAPTILDFAGAPPIGQGHSLVGAIVRGEPLEDRDVLFGTAILRARDAQSLFKLGTETDPPFFYDLTADPGERVNLEAQDGFEERERTRLNAARSRLSTLQQNAQSIAKTLQSASDTAVPEAKPSEDEELRRLGYGGG